MIFIDSNEKSTTLPKIPNSAWVDNLEALTGADIVVTLLPVPPPTTEARVRLHLREGAYLIQVKMGLDIASSVGPRLNASLTRMQSAGAAKWQCVLLVVGVVTCDREGRVRVDGRKAIPERDGSYKAVRTAIARWGDRGGSVHLPLSKPSLVKSCLDDLESNLELYREHPLKEVWAPGPSMAQFLEPVDDWRVTLAAMPGAALGPKRLDALRDAIRDAGQEDTLLTALRWLTRDDAAKVVGIGAGIKAKVRAHVGLIEGENIVSSRTYPTTLVFPENANVAVPHGRWRRIEGGQVEATFESQEELALCMGVCGEHREEVWRAAGISLAPIESEESNE